jgi:hypothetical protein
MYFEEVGSQIVRGQIGGDGQQKQEAQCRSVLLWSMRQSSGGAEGQPGDHGRLQ